MTAFVSSLIVDLRSSSRVPRGLPSKSSLLRTRFFCERRKNQILWKVHQSQNRNVVRMADDSPPLNVPSGVLLLASSVLAIASIGCVFELTGGNPMFGPAATKAILAVSLPGFLFLFYSAIRKGQQEALEDS